MNFYLIVTLLSLLFFSFTSQVFLIWPWHGRVLSFDLLRLLVPFNFFIGMFLWNFYLAAKTDPGWVLEDWHKGFVTDGQEKDLKGRLRYCYICNKYKPPRTHHCSICQRCVLCMDHHCSWLGQCVGYFNHGYQIRTLIYANLTCIYHIFMITAHIYAKPVVLKRADLEVIMIGLNYANVIPFFACVFYFSYTQLSPLLRNRTIIENWLEGNLDKELKEKAQFPYVSLGSATGVGKTFDDKQDLGVWPNIETLLGANPFLWWYPRRASGDGMSYPIVAGAKEPWPPLPEGEENFEDKSLDDSNFVEQCAPFNLEMQEALRQRRTIQFTASDKVLN